MIFYSQYYKITYVKSFILSEPTFYRGTSHIRWLTKLMILCKTPQFDHGQRIFHRNAHYIKSRVNIHFTYCTEEVAAAPALKDAKPGN